MSQPHVYSISVFVPDGFLLYLLACFLTRLQRAHSIKQQQPGSERFAHQFNGDFSGIGISLDVDEDGRLVVQHVGRCFYMQRELCTPVTGPELSLMSVRCFVSRSTSMMPWIKVTIQLSLWWAITSQSSLTFAQAVNRVVGPASHSFSYIDSTAHERCRLLVHPSLSDGS